MTNVVRKMSEVLRRVRSAERRGATTARLVGRALTKSAGTYFLPWGFQGARLAAPWNYLIFFPLTLGVIHILSV